MKRKGFTSIDLLVAIVSITLLAGTLVAPLNRARQTAVRLVCETNLGGIGKAMAVYSGDNLDQYPRAGLPGGTWICTGSIVRWDEPRREVAFGTTGDATITASFYLLVKFENMTPKQFVCKGDEGAMEFRRSDLYRVLGTMRDWWDFGAVRRPGQPTISPGQFCSYSYHMPYVTETDNQYPITEGSPERSPVCADRNPYLDTNTGYTGGNTFAHLRKGQNVLYKDGSTRFEQTVTVGIGGDNIYTYAADPNNPAGDPVGIPPSGVGDVRGPVGPYDAYLVNESNEK